MKRLFSSSIATISALFLYLGSLKTVLYAAGAYADVFCNGNPNDGVKTALGCISTQAGSNGLVESILKIGLGLGGGIALSLLLYGTFIVTTSAGIPDKLKEGQEVITSAIVGLLFIVLSVFLVNIIGINILGLPGLT